MSVSTDVSTGNWNNNWNDTSTSSVSILIDPGDSGANFTAGNLAVVLAQAKGSNLAASIHDTLNLAWELVGYQSVNGFTMWAWVAPTANGGDTITIQFSSSVPNNAMCWEAVSTLGSNFWVDVVGANGSASAVATGTVAVTTNSASPFLYGQITNGPDSTGGAITLSAPATSFFAHTASGQYNTNWGTQAGSGSAGTNNFTGTWSGGTNGWDGIVVSVNDVAPSGGLDADVVQHTGSHTGTSATSLNATFGSNITSGNFLVVVAATDAANGNDHTVTDNLGNSWTLQTGSDANSNPGITLWTAPVTNAGACTVNLATTTSDSMALTIFEVTNSATVESVATKSINASLATGDQAWAPLTSSGTNPTLIIGGAAGTSFSGTPSLGTWDSGRKVAPSTTGTPDENQTQGTALRLVAGHQAGFKPVGAQAISGRIGDNSTWRMSAVALSIPSGVTPTGSTALTEGHDRTAATATVTSSGSASTKESHDRVSAFGGPVFGANAQMIEGHDIVVATAMALVTGHAAILEGPDGVAIRQPVYTVRFTFLPVTGPAPLTIDFTDTSTISPSNFPDHKIGWNWDFGDGYGSSQQNPTHVYAKGGSYTVQLRVTWFIGGVTGPGTAPLSVNAPITPPGPTLPPAPKLITVDQYIALIIPEHNSGELPPLPKPALGIARIVEGPEGGHGSSGAFSTAMMALLEGHDNASGQITLPAPTGFDPAVTGPGITLSNSNTTASITTADQSGTRSVNSYAPGNLRYVEWTVGNIGNTQWIGITDPFYDGTAIVGFTINSNAFQSSNGRRVVNGSSGTAGLTFTTGDVVGLAIDTTTRHMRVFVNNIETLLADTRALPGSGNIYLAASPYANGVGVSTGTMNFGQNAFVYAPPAGYTAGW